MSMCYGDIEDNLVAHADALAELDGRVRAIEAKLAVPQESWRGPLSEANQFPHDLAEAIELGKLAIIRHRADKWYMVPQGSVVAALRALAEFASSPYDAGTIQDSKNPSSVGGCRIVPVKHEHDRKCQACGMHSATLYRLDVGQMSVNICPFCKASIRMSIEKIEGSDGY